MKSLVLIYLFIFLVSCGEKDAQKRVEEHLEKDEVTLIDSNDAKMKKAIESARNTVDEFIKVLSSNDATIQSLSVKVPLSDGEQTEHTWLGELTYKNDEFTGKISNEIQKVKNFKIGQEVSFAKNKITDWMYVKNGVVHGNVTLKAMFHTMDPEEVKVLKKMMGWSK